MKAVTKYPGAKWKLAEQIISLFPQHHTYLEPFFGSGAVLFSKQRSDIETVNDIDGEVVNLFDCILKDPEKLARIIYFTPYARDVYEKTYTSSTNDKFQRAVNFYIQLNMGHGFRTTGEKVGWKEDICGRERAYAAVNWCCLPDRLIDAAERLRGVQIENRPAEEVITHYNDKRVFIYCDPPYMPGTRQGKTYRHEMTEEQHKKLLEVLLAHKGCVMISGYDSVLYNDMLCGWYKYEKVSYTQAASKRTEVLWMNYEPPCHQMTLEEYKSRSTITCSC